MRYRLRSVCAAFILSLTLAQGAHALGHVEGSEYALPRWGVPELTLPVLNAFDRQPRYIEVFNRGEQPFEFKIASSEPWVTLSQRAGSVQREQRILVNVNWSEVPAKAEGATLTVTGPEGAKAKVKLRLQQERAADGAPGSFVGTGGVVSMEAATTPARWRSRAASGCGCPTMGAPGPA